MVTLGLKEEITWHNGHRQTILVMGSLLTCLSHPSLLTFLSLDSENSFWDSIVFHQYPVYLNLKNSFWFTWVLQLGNRGRKISHCQSSPLKSPANIHIRRRFLNSMRHKTKWPCVTRFASTYSAVCKILTYLKNLIWFSPSIFLATKIILKASTR